MSNNTPRPELLLDRRHALLGLGAAGAVAAFGLSGCSDEPAPAPEGSGDAGSSSDDAQEAQIDAAAYDELVASALVADDAVVEASAWASKIRDAGSMRVGGVQTSLLFCLMNEKDNKVRGFDAGLFQMLARYILGDENAYELTQVTSDTRESVLTNDQVDAVFATYSITDERKEIISFAGPYYTTHEEARTALKQGRVDAYVIDTAMQMGSMTREPGVYRLAGEEFGPVDAYGIGLPLDSDGVEFVNTWLVSIEEDGTWSELWKVCIGDRAEVETAPEPPAIGA